VTFNFRLYHEYVEATNGEQEKCGNHGERLNMVRKDSGTDQAFENAQGSKAEIFTKNGEKGVEEGLWPDYFRHYENDNLEND
jgi:hypothetical protein